MCHVQLLSLVILSQGNVPLYESSYIFSVVSGEQSERVDAGIYEVSYESCAEIHHIRTTTLHSENHTIKWKLEQYDSLGQTQCQHACV